MNVIELLKEQLNPNLISQLSNQIGADSEDQTEAAVSGVISALVTGLAKNAQQPGGANAIVSAVDRDHDGSLLDDVAGFLLGGRQASNPKTMNGAGILGHIFGNNQSLVTDTLSKGTGLKNLQIGKLLMILAPLVLAAIGKARNQNGLDTGGIGDLLKRTVTSNKDQGKEVGIFERLLDKNGDGSVMDDITNMGKKFLLGRK